MKKILVILISSGVIGWILIAYKVFHLPYLNDYTALVGMFLLVGSLIGIRKLADKRDMRKIQNLRGVK